MFISVVFFFFSNTVFWECSRRTYCGFLTPMPCTSTGKSWLNSKNYLHMFYFQYFLLQPFISMLYIEWSLWLSSQQCFSTGQLWSLLLFHIHSLAWTRIAIQSGLFTVDHISNSKQKRAPALWYFVRGLHSAGMGLLKQENPLEPCSPCLRGEGCGYLWCNTTPSS